MEGVKKDILLYNFCVSLQNWYCKTMKFEFSNAVVPRALAIPFKSIFYDRKQNK